MRMPHWLWLFVIAALIWSWSLHLLGWLVTPKGYRYFWILPLYPADCNFHLSWARQAYDGKNRFADLFTTEEHAPLTFNLHDWLIGKLSRWVSISLHISMKLLHTIGVIFFIIAAWWLSVPILTESQQRTYLLMLCFLGGFISLGMPEANTYIALTTFSWFVWGKALLAVLIGSIIRMSMEENNGKMILIGSLSGILLGNIHPYALAPICYALPLWLFLNWAINKRMRSEILLSLIPVSSAIFSAALQAFAILGDPVYQVVFRNPPSLAPPIWYFILNYGLIFFLAVLASIQLLRKLRMQAAESLLIFWFVGSFLAVYLTPTALERRLIEGAHLPMCILASLSWHKIILKRAAFLHRIQLLVLMLLGGIAPLNFWAFQAEELITNSRPDLHLHKGLPLFLSEQHLQLLEWLESNTMPDEVILCSYELGNYIPALTGRKVFIGHWSLTINLDEKFKIARKIWRGELPINEARELFRKHRIRYALATIYERHATKTKHLPEYCPYLPEHFHIGKYGEVVFRIGDDAIYKLQW